MIPDATTPLSPDVAGWYDPDQAAAAAKGSMTDQGSGNWRMDD